LDCLANSLAIEIRFLEEKKLTRVTKNVSSRTTTPGSKVKEDYTVETWHWNEQE
jgi:hypothetical protein